MKKLFISDLKIGDSIFGETLAVKSYVKKSSRNNKPYIDLELSDATGTIKGKIWSDDFPNCDQVNDGDVVVVNGTIDDFNGPQLKISNMKKTDKFEMADLQQKSAFDTERMWGDIEKAIKAISNPHLRALLENIFSDDDLREKFKTWPAAYKIHQNYIGGLLEHTWEMLRIAATLKDHYPKLNMDLVNTGIILHDIGKTVEYTQGTTIGFTDRGKLLGHEYIGAEIAKHSAHKDMPEDLLNEVLHIIISHLGNKEFGAPKVPMTAEAMAVYVIDLASARINMAYTLIHGNLGKENFTQYVPQLGAELYRSPYTDDLSNEDIPF
jgi:3'-5' exoribonuclease